MGECSKASCSQLHSTQRSSGVRLHSGADRSLTIRVVGILDWSTETHQARTDMDLQLNGKRALVTGSTAGIGFAAAAGLFREGASVVVNGRTPDRVEDAVMRIQGMGGIGQVSGV